MEAYTGIQRHLGIVAVACIFSSVFASQAVAGKTKIVSSWLADSVQIDGSESEWEVGRYYLDESKLAVGVRNDGEYLYVHFVTTDESTERQIFMHGLTVWFDPDGGDDEVFGVHYPLGVMGDQVQPPRDGLRGDPRNTFAMSDSVAPEMELLDEQGEVIQRLLTGAQADIDARISMTDNRLVYELRVPLYFNDAHPHAIGTMAGAHVGIGLETPEIEFNREKMGGMPGGPGPRGGGPGGQGGGMPPGGFGGQGRGPGGGGPRGERPSPPEPLKIWLDVGLASTPETGND